MLRELIYDFWTWAGISPETYASGLMIQPIDEYMYPRWDELISATNAAINRQIIESQTIDDILTVMALDNENEDVLDYLSTCNTSEVFIQTLESAGILHMQHHARWQIAVLLSRRKSPSSQEMLNILAHDDNAYVRKRACNSLKDLCSSD